MDSKPETGLDGLFQAFGSDNWPTVRDAVDEGGGLLRHAGMDPSVHAQLGKQMIELAKHGKWEVRKALAHAILFLRHESFNRIIAILERDENSWVKNAAKRTLTRRSELSKADLLKDEHGDRMLSWLTDLDAKHGSRAREAAKRVAENLQTQFVRELNHEMVKVISPLDASLENLEIALSQPRLDRDNLQKHTNRARSRLKFMSSILHSFQELTRDSNIEFQTENLLSIIEETVHLVRDRKEENRSMSVELNVDQGIMLEANRHLLLQALSNIVQNSIDAYGKQKQTSFVRIGATVENGIRTTITITDQGCGMPDDAVRDAFRLFASSKPDGTGFGLTIAKKIIESDHAGLVQLASAKGNGTTVTIALPLKQEEQKW